MKHIPSFLVRTVRHNEQEYNTPGNYGKIEHMKDPEIWWVAVSRFSNPIFELALVVHEMIELTLCIQAKIKDKDIVAFDKSQPEHDNPGILKDAPYHKQHMIAEAIEKMIIKLTGNSWKEYCEECDKLFNSYKPKK